jgi:hypothetical protein
MRRTESDDTHGGTRSARPGTPLASVVFARLALGLVRRTPPPRLRSRVMERVARLPPPVP